jgi:hypothetical protein
MVRIDADGVAVIPVAVHEQRMVDMKDALKNEQLMFLERRKVLVDEQMECDAVEAIFYGMICLIMIGPMCFAACWSTTRTIQVQSVHGF